MNRPRRLPPGPVAPARAEDARFCTEHSLAAGEPLAGWGRHPARNLLIQWPKGRWQHAMRIGKGMDAEVEAAIEELADAGWRINLIDRKGEPDDKLRVFVFPGAGSFALDPEDLAAFLNAVLEGPDALARFGPTPAAKPLILCCTHSQHDRCCAKWGFAVYKAFAAEIDESRDIDLWECTHLGGCRFAAGVLVLPALRKYGRVAPVHVADLLQAEREDRPYLPCYRGGSLLSEPAQAAEVTGLSHLAGLGVTGSATIKEAGPRTFDITVAGVTTRVRVRDGTVSSHGNCAGLHAADPVAPRIAWHASVLNDDVLQSEHPARQLPRNERQGS